MCTHVYLYRSGVGKLFWVAGQMSPRQACRGPGWKNQVNTSKREHDKTFISHTQTHKYI